jgi:hypothetical protein
MIDNNFPKVEKKVQGLGFWVEGFPHLEHLGTRLQDLGFWLYDVGYIV